MTPEQLKTSILKAAFDGKLVEQNRNDEKVEVLLSRVNETQKKAIKEGKIKKNTKFAEVKDDEIHSELPLSWSYIKLGEISQLVDGEKIKGTEYNYLEVKYLRGKTEPKKMTEGKYAPKGEKVILVDGENSGEVFELPEDGYLGSTFKVLYICPEMYVDYVLKFFELKRSELRGNKKGAAIPHLDKELLFNYVLPVPPIEEQHRIVAKIEELLPYVDRYAASWEKLEHFNAKFPEDMRKSILQYAIQGKLVEQRPEEGTAEELYQQIQSEKQKLIKEGKIKKEKPLAEIAESEIPFDIPESWKWVRLGEIINFQGGYAFKSDTYVPSSNNQVIRLGNVKDNNLLTHSKEVFISDELAKIAEDYQIKVDDILVTMTGTRRKKDYFFTLVVKSNDLMERKLYLNQRVGCFRAMSGIDVEYLLVVLQTSSIKDIIFLHETGTANQGNLGSEDMKQFVYIPLPPIAEQHRIVAKIEELLPYCDRLIEK
jgi:type I restriction enzyme S subunit